MPTQAIVFTWISWPICDLSQVGILHTPEVRAQRTSMQSSYHPVIYVSTRRNLPTRGPVVKNVAELSQSTL
ncbi:hypothetical protein F5Y07DRAFT_371537 [Xylaria sp. FL0933]|nr:hypothetical protein F5Y07DRAFT_371537 [Xylaria sp. FL0933]